MIEPFNPSRVLREYRSWLLPETFLKTQQVAEALGVSVSTIKRWVDIGALAAPGRWAGIG